MRQSNGVFTPENYESYYDDHHFIRTPGSAIFKVHEFVPRFGWAFDQVEELQPKNLLDLGCLDGGFALSVCKNLGVPVTGVDLTKDGIKMAMNWAAEFKLDAHFHQGFVEDHLVRLAAEGKQYDVVTMFEIIEHVLDVPLLLKLIEGVLAPGGHVLLSTPSYESELYGADDEKNTCHVRLYTLEGKDYEKPNKYGTIRKATSLWRELSKYDVEIAEVRNHLINARYKCQT